MKRVKAPANGFPTPASDLSSLSPDLDTTREILRLQNRYERMRLHDYMVRLNAIEMSRRVQARWAQERQESPPPPQRASNKGGRRKLHPDEIATFQDRIIQIIKTHASKNKEERITEERVIERMDMTIQKWRMRIKRVYQNLEAHGVYNRENF